MPVLALSVLLVCFSLTLITNSPLRIDELTHYPQILLFFEGRWELYKFPGENYSVGAMIPGYHALMATFANVFGNAEPHIIRLYAFCLSLCLLPCAYLLARGIDSENAGLRTAQMYFLPILFPFYFLIYTDILSLALLLASLFACRDRCFKLAGALSFLSLFVRQANIVFVFFCCLLHKFGVF